METMKYEIPLLDCSTRFSLWQVKMRTVLVKMDLGDAFLWIDKMSSSLTKEKKERKDRKTLSHIDLLLSNKILQDVLKEKTIDVLWLKLEELCMMKILTSKLHLKQQLYSHSMVEGTSLEGILRPLKKLLWI